MDVDRVLSSLDRSLPAGAAASWFDAAAEAGAGGSRRTPAGAVRDLVAGLTAVLDRSDGAGGGTALLVETAAQTVLVHHLGTAGALVVEAGKGLNLALVRRAVALALDGVEEEEPVAAEPVRLPARRGGIATAFPRRTPPPSVTDFGYVPEDTEVLRMLEQALST